MKQKVFPAFILTVLIALSAQVAFTQTTVEEARVRAHMEFLASDEMQGRGSGTAFEKLAGLYIASQLKQFGIAAVGDKNAEGLGSYLQTVEIERSTVGKVELSAGKKSVELVSLQVGGPSFEGPLERIGINENAKPGSIAIVTTEDGDIPRSKFRELFSSPAKALLIVAPKSLFEKLAGFIRRGSSLTTIKGVESRSMFTSLFLISEENAKVLEGIAGGTAAEINAELTKRESTYTWNAVGKIEGTDDSGEAILLSAHMDHIGVQADAPGDDKIFNGADDDASGCVAVLELARILAQGAKPKRTVYFAFFGSEEAGGYGSRYFVGTLPVPLEKLVANLQFEMLGRPDAKVKADQLWLTGFERSNLGPALAKNGAKLVADPHPEQNFFERSDNIALARNGIVAHTVSSYGLHADYHRASDEIKTIDFGYMTKAIDSMVAPIRWLANTDWKPSWNEGGRP